MGNKKRIVLVLVFINILIFVFFFQKKLIDKFSLEPERLELYLKENDEVLPIILEEEEYIAERYIIEYGENKLDKGSFVISIQKFTNIEDEFFKERFINHIKFKIPQLEEERLNIIDYSNSIRVLRVWHDVNKVFIGCLSFIIIIIFLIRRAKIIKKYLKKDLMIYYPKEIIKLRVNEILEEAIRLSLLIFSGIFLLKWIISFQFNIPGEYLPANNIFEFEFYKALTKITEINLSSYGYFYDITLNKVRLLTLGFSILSTITFLLIIKRPNYKVMEGRDKCGESGV